MRFDTVGRVLRGRGEARFPQLWPLAVLTLVVTALTAADALPRWPGVIHLVALPPIDLYTDLRLLLIRAPSGPVFVLGLLGALAVRVVVLALLLGGLTRDRLRLAMMMYLAVLPLLLLAAELAYIAAAVLYSRLFWVAVSLLALVALLAGPAPWQGSTRLRTALKQSWRGGLRVEVMIPYTVILVGLSALAERFPAATVALIPVSGAATAGAVRLLARPVAGRPLRRLATAAAAFLVVATVFVATRGVKPTSPAAPRPGSILLMSGINSASGRGTIFSSRTDVLGYTCAQTFYFSYAGPGNGQPQGRARCPIRTGAPYQKQDTQRPFAEQVRVFAEQVRDLPRPLVVAGHSHAVWVAWETLASGAAPQVDALIMVGPFPQSPVGYPPPGRDGPGRVAGDLLRLLVPLTDLAQFHFEPDAPASRELLAAVNRSEEIHSRPLPAHARAVGVTSATDLPLMPGGWRLPVDRNACPIREAHPYLPDTPAFYHEVNRFLDRRPGLLCPPWRTWGKPMALPFGVPPMN